VAPLPRERVGFPTIRGVTYNGRMHTGDLFDFGPKFAEGILTTLPPRLVGTPYPALVPKTDADGNDLAGIRIPEVAVPLATYTGWALRAAPAGGDPSHVEYVDAVAAAAHGLVRDRLLLEEDVPAYVKKAQDAPVGK
jgi:hypothetical protein